MATFSATTRQLFGLFGGLLAAMGTVFAVLTPLVLGAARTEANEAVARQADIDRSLYVTKVEVQAILRELDQVRSQLDRIEARMNGAQGESGK